jgi:ParB family chromosome partitioning protein
LLRHLDAKEQAAFDQAWAVHQARFTRELAELRRQSKERRPVRSQSTPAQLRELAFGAYVGLVREQGGSTVKKGQSAGAATDPQVSRVRQTALNRLQVMAGSDPHFADAARPVFVQALGDPNQVVRLQAFEHAQAVGMGATELAAEALATGHIDLGVKGLELLTGGASEAEGAAVLERAMLARKDDLAIEAGKLLAARRGFVTVASRALEAAHEPLRSQAVNWLAAEYDKELAARDALRGALASRYQAVREAAAFAMATKKDPAAFEALVAHLAGEASKQMRAIRALESLGDPRATAAFLDRIENDPSGTARAEDLIKAVGRFRRPEVADRLLALWDKQPKWRIILFDALLTISGHDQPIQDSEDEQPGNRWEEKQFPRHDDVLARLMDRVSAPADAKFLVKLILAARWARGKAVDPVLGGLINHSNDEVRQKAVEAIGWRLRKRGSNAEPLRKALGHRDPITQFLAAEALAKAGRGDGLNILLASVDFATDLAIRQRAVIALGELADERALDVLLKLAGEDGHALQEQAAEAIGHLGRSPRADEIFKLLERNAKGYTGVGWSALNGLRWLDTRAGWQLIRERAVDRSYPFRALAVELLGYHDDSATGDLLLRLLAEEEDSTVIDPALAAARRLWGSDALEPDYAVLQNEAATVLEDHGSTVARVRDRGAPQRIFEILPKCPDEVRATLAAGLLSRPEPAAAEARTALDLPDPTVAGLAAHLLGRAGALAVDAGPALANALSKWWTIWNEKRPAFDRTSLEGERLADSLNLCLRDLVWAAGRLGVARDALAKAASAWPEDPESQPIRLAAVLALGSDETERTPGAVAALESAAIAGDPKVRAAAAQALARRDPQRASTVAGRLLSDRVGFDRLVLDGAVEVEDSLRAAARQVHYQGVVIPGLIDRGDVATLAAVAEDRSLPEATRLGAVEGLAAMGREPAEDVLRRVGMRADEDEEFRKAAWRGLRRSKRARQKVAAAPKAEVKS